MIWTTVTCSSFIIFRLPHQHILLLCYISLPSPCELLNGCKELFFRRVAIPLIDSCLCSFLATLQAPFEHSAAGRCYFSTNCRYDEYPTVQRLLYAETTWSNSAHDNDLPFWDFCPCALWPLDLVMMHQVFRGMHG